MPVWTPPTYPFCFACSGPSGSRVSRTSVSSATPSSSSWGIPRCSQDEMRCIITPESSRSTPGYCGSCPGSTLFRWGNKFRLLLLTWRSSTPSSPSMFQLLIPSFTPFRPRWFRASANSQTTSSTVKELDLSQENWFKSDSEWKVIRGSLHHGLQQRSITNANWYNFKLALAPAKNHHWVCFGHKEVFKAYTAIQRNFISFQLLVPTNSFFLSLLRAREDRWGLERRLNVKSKAPNTRGNQA